GVPERGAARDDDRRADHPPPEVVVDGREGDRPAERVEERPRAVEEPTHDHEPERARDREPARAPHELGTFTSPFTIFSRSASTFARAASGTSALFRAS